jgi:hypothetical protein
MKRTINPELTAKVIDRDNARCRWCGFANATRQLEADHIVPESKGGETTLANLQCLCSACNKIKGVTELPPMAIKGAIKGFGNFASVERKRDELTAMVKTIKTDTQADLTTLARQWFAGGMKKIYIKKRLAKMTTDGKIQKILKSL